MPKLVAIEALRAGFEIWALLRIVAELSADVAIRASFPGTFSLLFFPGSFSLLFLLREIQRPPTPLVLLLGVKIQVLFDGTKPRRLSGSALFFGSFPRQPLLLFVPPLFRTRNAASC